MGVQQTPQTTGPTMAALMIKADEAAALAGVSTRTILRGCADGSIPAAKIRGTWRINKAAFLAKLGIE